MNKLLTVLLTFTVGAHAAPPRPPAVAGAFYPADAKELSALVERFWEAAPDPTIASEDLAALLVPHAGFEFSGATAAKAYKALKKGGWDTVVLVGAAHRAAVAGAALYPGPLATPEGVFRYDEALARRLLAASPLIKADAAAHEGEHSLEVQLPFIRRALGPKVKVVGLVMNSTDFETVRRVGEALAAALKGRKALLVASSDLSHYPTGPVAEAVDTATLEALAGLDAERFWLADRVMMSRRLPGLDTTWCGESAVTAVLVAAKALGAKSLRLLGRTHSGEARPEAGSARVVGYAAAAFLKSGAPPAPRAFSAEEKAELLRLARRSLEDYLKTGRVEAPPLYRSTRLNLPGAAFVTLKKDGALRGCIGSLVARESLAESVARNAVAAGVSDKRFPLVTADELPSLHVEVAALSAPRPVAGAAAVKVGDGVTLQNGERGGVFLPSVWESLPGKEDFLAELCSQKAGLPRDCVKDPATKLQVFATESFEE